MTATEPVIDFQVLDWYVHDVLTHKGHENVNARVHNGGSGRVPRSVNQEYSPSARFTIEAYGVNSAGESCALTIEEYHPYFLIALPHRLTDETADTLIRGFVPEYRDPEQVYDSECEKASVAYISLQDNRTMRISSFILPEYMRDDLLLSECTQVDRYPFYGYQFNRPTSFLKMVFTNEKARKRAARAFETGILVNNSIFKPEALQHPGCVFYTAPTHTLMQFKLYENNVEPLLRFLHERNLNACGFIRIHDANFRSNCTTCSAHSGTCKWTEVHPIEDERPTAPVMMCSFDIEASSSHGDFPIANKGYDKLSTQLLDYIFNTLYAVHSRTWRGTPSSPVNAEEAIRRVLIACFKADDAASLISRVFTIDAKVPSEECLAAVAADVVSMFEHGMSAKLQEGDSVNVRLPGRPAQERDVILAVSSYEERYNAWAIATQKENGTLCTACNNAAHDSSSVVHSTETGWTATCKCGKITPHVEMDMIQSRLKPDSKSRDKEEKLLAGWVQRVQGLYANISPSKLPGIEQAYKRELEALPGWKWDVLSPCADCNAASCFSKSLEELPHKKRQSKWNAHCVCGHVTLDFKPTATERECAQRDSSNTCRLCNQPDCDVDGEARDLKYDEIKNEWRFQTACNMVQPYHPTLSEIVAYNRKKEMISQDKDGTKILTHMHAPQYQLQNNGGTRRWWETVSTGETVNKTVGELVGIQIMAVAGTTPPSYSAMTKPEQKKRKAALHAKLTARFDTMFPPVQGDTVIQIASVFWKYGETQPCRRHLLTLGSIDPIADVEVARTETERELLVQWSRLMREMKPSVLTGYNIFGFDEKFMWERADALDCLEEFGLLSVFTRYETVETHVRHSKSPNPVHDVNSGFIEDPKSCRCHDGKMKSKLMMKELKSAGLGDNCLYFMDIPGIVQVDLFKLVMRDHNLSSYKLDDVASTFINGKLLEYDTTAEQHVTIITDNVYGLAVGDFVKLHKTSIIGEEDVGDGSKLEIEQIEAHERGHRMVLRSSVRIELDTANKYKWGLAKDDVTPNDIFNAWRPGGTAAQRAEIGKYCVQDAQLVMQLLLKLQVLANNMGMASVCSVPLQYIFTRGQGIKTFSLVVRECAKLNTVIPNVRQRPFLRMCQDDVSVLESVIDREQRDTANEREIQQFGSSSVTIITEQGETDDSSAADAALDGYQGAFVLEPQPGVYIDDAVAVVDYSSLYPNSIISENLCPSTHVTDPTFLGASGAVKLHAKGLRFKDIEYDNFVYEKKGKTVHKRINIDNPITTCRFVQPEGEADGSIRDEKRGILPRILRQILDQRKQTRKRMKSISDPFQYDVLEGRQLAYKVTANSVYGSLGARVSQIYYKDIAASTTSTGRRLLLLAKEKIEEQFEGSEIIYGDTDSVFINFHPKAEDGTPLKGKAALTKTIELGKLAGEHVNQFLDKPHDLEYEKTFWPFILFSKKRYVGNKYEMTDDKFKLSYMGIVLKRRDNAPIVKYMYADVIDTILNQHDVAHSIDRLHTNLKKLKEGKEADGGFPLQYLVISKALRSHYATPEAVVHKVLADRMAERDPGNKPQSNDRIPYVYVEVIGRTVKLQGERVEHPSYIKKAKLTPDYAFYIEKQISKPISQIYALVLETLPGYTHANDPHYFAKKRIGYENDRFKRDTDAINKKIEDDRMKEVYELIFQQYVEKEEKVTTTATTTSASSTPTSTSQQLKITQFCTS
jgi:DNA polymerase elongation subunit (family B)